ncbi:unnamed protein product [Phytomonas sp. EM1]|nr:unnamed protein product [Phytomonas sp. EM1]|eukprot:CCW62210.1 unnamed protein product [Phytomonas sp. isolate EM1]
MPFGRITEKLATSALDFLGGTDSESFIEFQKMPLWNRCMLAVVIPIVLQRHKTQYQDQRGYLSDKKVASDSIEATKVTHNDLEVALRIVSALDDLEVTAERIKSTWEDEGERCDLGLYDEIDTTHNNKAHQRPRDHCTEDDICTDGMLQEHIGSDVSWLSSCSSDSSTIKAYNGHSYLNKSNETREKEEVDIAMCFNLDGVSIGMGNASLFGGHGYHPLQAEK